MMKNLLTIRTLLMLLCLLAGCTADKTQMLQQLETLEQQNRADSVMTNDSLALTLANWFDRHGTPNEQLRAYYILGRTYADLGETPRAIEAYNKAAECADTTAANCDYAKLCRVYSQMAVVFYNQNLLKDNLHSLDQSILYAIKANDTLAAFNSYAQKMGTYGKLKEPDSVIRIGTDTYRRFCSLGKPDVGARYLAPAIRWLVEKKDYDKAKLYMSIYETQSGYFDCNGNIDHGREVYYNIIHLSIRFRRVLLQERIGIWQRLP